MHSSVLVWRIPWTEEPGGLESMGHKELDMTVEAHTERYWGGRGNYFPFYLPRFSS